MAETKEKLEAFNWDEQAKEVDFFGENAPEGMVIDSEEDLSEKEVEKKSEEKKEKSEEDTKKEAIADEDSLFADLEEKEPVKKEDEDSEEEKTTGKTSYKNIYTSLKSSGIFEDDEAEDVENLEVTEELIVGKIEQSVEKRFEESIKELPDELKNIIKFVSNGGDFYEIVGRYSDGGELNADLDLSEPENQEMILRTLLEEDGTDEDIVNSQIEFYKDSGKLESMATKYFEKWKTKRDADVKADVERQREAKQKAIQNQKTFKKELTSFISESESVKGLSVNKKDVSELPDYISTTSVKLQDGRQITPFYRDLFEAFKDKEKVVILAKLIKNGFDFSDIKKEVSTRQTREIKNDLQRQKNQPKEAHKVQKRLVDLID